MGETGKTWRILATLSGQSSGGTSSPRRKYLTALLLAGSIGCSVLVFLYRHDIERLGRFGYLGAFILPVIGNAMLWVPFPWIFIVGSMSSFYSPVWLAVVAGTGATIGELVPYVLGLHVSHPASANGLSKRLSALSWWKKTAIIVATAFSPIISYPGFAAGVLRYPMLVTAGITLAAETTKVWLVVEAARLGFRAFGV